MTSTCHENNKFTLVMDHHQVNLFLIIILIADSGNVCEMILSSLWNHDKQLIDKSTKYRSEQ